MAEPEDLLVDAARHATVFIRDTWRRHYAQDPDQPVALASLARRLDLLLSAACGTSFPMRVALPPARPTMLHRFFNPAAHPRHRRALPATNDSALWLPAHLGTCDPLEAAALYRAMALQQAFRAKRGSAGALLALTRPLLRDTALVLEAQAAEAEVARRFPGLLPALERLRRLALRGRPAVEELTPARQPLERLVRSILGSDLRAAPQGPASVEDSAAQARALLDDWDIDRAACRRLRPMPLYRDWWAGKLRQPGDGAKAGPGGDARPAGTD